MADGQLSVNHGSRRRSKTSTASYRRFYELAPDTFAIIDAKTGRVLGCNRALVSTTGDAKREIAVQALERDGASAAALRPTGIAVSRSPRI